jgi:hypothetical protein
MSIWSPTAPSPNYEAEQELRSAWFAKIEPAGNWKGPIDCWIEAEDLADCNQAAIWFTGGPLTYVASKGTKVHVAAPGYYATIGA